MRRCANPFSASDMTSDNAADHRRRTLQAGTGENRSVTLKSPLHGGTKRTSLLAVLGKVVVQDRKVVLQRAHHLVVVAGREQRCLVDLEHGQAQLEQEPSVQPHTPGPR